ncbi:aspartate aminotransferase family protein [Desulfosarcina ovata]|uniref:Aspartate aminotransferase family protein n=1 Tax=Desulfosarcina ovata subsp. ovata TaxID=2752305 RepID=A0A5K8A818_9BACT|nr:aminotransferase class III-fold pyridoxal phosphate-dependent enzyme [Desulfosarcina ovata]BBO88793.1 aspartate aminotransferase family protein [Desulfosarcina ovata subsp. ovata]
MDVSMLHGADYTVEEMVGGDRDYLWHHIKPHQCFQTQEQMIIVAGKGLTVTDIHGRDYLDATSGGVWCVNVGYGRESIAEAVAAQLKQMSYFAGSVGTIPTIKLSAKLLELLPAMGKVYYSNSGSEANEKSYKLIRQASAIDPARKGKYKILYRDRDYHGTTIAVLASSGQAERKTDFGPFPEGFARIPHCLCYRCPFALRYPACDVRCARCVEEIILKEGPDTVGGLIVEPITAGGGIIVPVDEYFPILQQICRKYGLFLVIDEVVAGFGRTGAFFGHQHFDVDPDMLTLAKGMASAYEPISATVVKQAVYDIFLNDPADPEKRLNFFRDISTYGGCTGAMAASLENIRIMEAENLVENSRVMGDYLLDRLKTLADHQAVGDVRGKGLFCGVELVADKKDKQPPSEAQMGAVVDAAKAAGVLLGRTNNSLPGFNTTLYYAPALVITREEADRMVAATQAAIETVFGA